MYCCMTVTENSKFKDLLYIYYVFLKRRLGRFASEAYMHVIILDSVQQRILNLYLHVFIQLNSLFF